METADGDIGRRVWMPWSWPGGPGERRMIGLPEAVHNHAVIQNALIAIPAPGRGCRPPRSRRRTADASMTYVEAAREAQPAICPRPRHGATGRLSGGGIGW